MKRNISQKNIIPLPPTFESKSADSKNVKPQRKKVSTVDDFKTKVKETIESILKQNCFGITLEMLYKELSTKIGSEIDFRIFNSKDFYDFLLHNADELVDIEIKRDSCVIYPKNYRFGPQAYMKLKSDEIEKTPNKTPQNYFPLMTDSRIMNPQQNRSPTTMETPPGLGKPIQKSTFSNVTPSQMSTASLSPMGLYGNEDLDTQTPEKQQSHVRVSSFWNLNAPNQYTEFEPTVSTFNSAHQRFKETKYVPEESTLEIQNNLKFIEELLKDENDEGKSSFANFSYDKGANSVYQMPNMSFGGISSIQQSSNHTKTQSEDLTSGWGSLPAKKAERKISK